MPLLLILAFSLLCVQGLGVLQPDKSTPAGSSIIRPSTALSILCLSSNGEGEVITRTGGLSFLKKQVEKFAQPVKDAPSGSVSLASGRKRQGVPSCFQRCVFMMTLATAGECQERRLDSGGGYTRRRRPRRRQRLSSQLCPFLPSLSMCVHSALYATNY